MPPDPSGHQPGLHQPGEENVHKVTPTRPHGGPTRRELCTTRAFDFPWVEVRCVTGRVCTPRGFNEWPDPNETAATRPLNGVPTLCGHVAPRATWFAGLTDPRQQTGTSPVAPVVQDPRQDVELCLRKGVFEEISCGTGRWPGVSARQPRQTKTAPSMARSPGPWHTVPRGSQLPPQNPALVQKSRHGVWGPSLSLRPSDAGHGFHFQLLCEGHEHTGPSARISGRPSQPVGGSHRGCPGP